ncbi:D-aminoacyl-tRNA deacylase [Candidatus Omnitrophota bacterium]
MRLLIQRVKRSIVHVDGRVVSEIKKGLSVFVGIGVDDNDEDIRKLAEKLVNLRIFEDDAGKMNLNLAQAKGEVLSVPQFTLFADTSRGNRPGFELSAKPDRARILWEEFNSLLKSLGAEVKKGVFGSHMDIELVNDGPVTIWLDSKSD